MHPKNGLWTDMPTAREFRRWLLEEDPDRVVVVRDSDSDSDSDDEEKDHVV